MNIVRAALALSLAVVFTVGAATPALAVSSKERKKAYQAITATARKQHLSGADTRALLKLAKRESSYNRRARNHSCKGLFQLKTKAPMRQWSNAAWNTRKAIAYMKHRYGSPARALRHSYRYGWY